MILKIKLYKTNHDAVKLTLLIDRCCVPFTGMLHGPGCDGNVQ